MHNSPLNTILLLIICLILFPSSTSAQIIPDNTLNEESSTVRSINNLRDAIEGGAIRGENLFHSFTEFSVKEGMSVDFSNPNGIGNIFSRVTGGNISEILGTIGVDGAANLFLINPNGIVFGENGSINVNGSFLATTSESIEFKDGVSFSTSNAENLILTIDFPVGLGFGSNPGDITVKGDGHTLSLNSSDSSIPKPIPPIINQPRSIKSQQNIALIGSNILFNGAFIETDNGKIEVAATKKGFVNFELSEWEFDYNKIEEFGDITLDSQALVNASGNSGSSIGIVGNTVSLKNGSLLTVQTQNSNFSKEININASNLEIAGGVVFDIEENGNINFTPK